MGLCIDILPLEVHEQPQTLAVIVIALTEDNLFKDASKLLLQVHVSLLTVTGTFLLQEGLHSVKTLLSLQNTILIARWGSHHQVGSRIQRVLLRVIFSLTELLWIVMLLLMSIIHSKVT